MRLAALTRYEILDTPPEPTLDALTRLASRICATPIAWISLIDADRQWIKSRVGCDLKETPREIAFCARAIEQQDLLIIPDARADERFAANPLVTDAPRIRFYAGAPLVTPDGHALGTMCALSQNPGRLSEAQGLALRNLAQEAMTQLELRREQLEANTAHARLSLITDVVPVMVAYVDATHCYRFVNKAYEGWFGCLRDEVLGKDLREVLGKDKYRDIYPFVQRVLSGHGVRFEELVRHGSGELRCISASYFPDRGKRGEVKGYVALMSDITERKRADEALRASEKRYRSLVTATASIVWSADPDGAMGDDFPSWQAFTGQTPEQYKGMGWLDALHPGDRQRVGEAWLRALKEKTPIESEHWVRHRDGRFRRMHNQIVPVFDRNGHLLERIGQSTDITHRKLAEQRLQYLASHDALTDLPNRALLMDRLNQALALGLRRNRSVAVLFLDLDDFKGVNDTLGHGAGDQLLQAVARRLVENVRDSDTVARLGGDEFVVMLTDINRPDDAGCTALNLLHALRRPFEVAGHSLTALASIGISVFPRDSADTQTLLRHADAAMYQAKDQGKCQYRQYSPAIATRTSHR